MAAPKLPPALCSPMVNRFTQKINNRYFPLVPVGRQWFLQEDADAPESLLITVLDQTETFDFGRRSVVTRVVEEREWVDADGEGDPDLVELVEVSRNYFAQSGTGTVCYFGEDVEIYENGSVVVSGPDAGSWRADDEGNRPGIFMPALPRPGQRFQMEGAPDIAEDTAEIIGFDTVTVPAGTFRAVLIEECNPLDNNECGDKSYGLFAGLIADADLELQ